MRREILNQTLEEEELTRMCWRKPLDANTGEILKFLKYFSGLWSQMGQSKTDNQMQLLDLIRFLQKKN